MGKKIAFKILISSISLFLPFGANSANLSCDNLTTSIYYVNGVNNNTADAMESTGHIQNAYLQKFKNKYPRQNFIFKLAYNLSRHYDADVREMVRQKLEERNLLNRSLASEEFQPWQLLYLYERNPDYFAKHVPEEYQFLGDLISTEVKNKCAPKPQIPDRVKTLNEHLALYRSDLNHGRRIILIPHSQGNLFANSALRKLRPQYYDNIGMVGVASTAGELLPNTFYVTAKDDSAIKYMRTKGFYWLYTGKIGSFYVLPGNIDNKYPTHWRDISKHAFYKKLFFL